MMTLGERIGIGLGVIAMCVVCVCIALDVNAKSRRKEIARLRNELSAEQGKVYLWRSAAQNVMTKEQFEYSERMIDRTNGASHVPITQVGSRAVNTKVIDMR